MNYRLMLRTLGRTLQLEGLCLFLPALVALGYREDPRPFCIPSPACCSWARP